MTFYSIVLFLHVTAVLGLFAALSFEALSLFHLRRVSSPTEARRWIELVPGLPVVTMASLLLILFSGIYLAVRTTAIELAWPKVTVAAVLLMAPFGALTGRRMRAIRRASSNANAVNGELFAKLHDPFLKISLAIRITVFLGIVLLMAAKPDLWQSVAIVGVSVALSLLVPLLTGRRAGTVSLPRTDVGT